MGPSPSRFRRVIPAGLGVGMLAVVLAAAIAPNTGAVPADTNCPYGVCPSNQTASLLPWIVALVVLVLIAAILAVLILRRKRRGRGPSPVEPWSASPPPGAAPAEPTPPSLAPVAPAAGAGAVAAYVETPEDVGAPPPAAPAAPAPARGAGGEADIDSLMQELDRISNEILKRGGTKPGPARPKPEPTETDGSEGNP